MRTLIIGAGDVGYDVARLLSLQRHDVTVIDTDAARLGHVRDTLDVMTVRGSGTSARVLETAGIRQADLVVAVTDVDEVNLVAAMVARRVGPETITIARVREGELSGEGTLTPSDFGLDLVIQPEHSTAREVVSLLRRAAASDVIELAGGRVQIVGLRVEPGSAVIGASLETLAGRARHLAFRVVGIVRGARTLVPRGTERIQRDDQLFVAVETGQVAQVAYVLGHSESRLDRVMIVGGTAVAGRIAAQLVEGSARRLRITLVEPEAERAHHLAEALEGVLVVHGRPDDIDLLVTEGLSDMDAFVAVTGDEEHNLVACLLAKHLGVRKTVAMLSKSAYIPISRSIGLDAAVSQKLAVSREVLRFLRGTHVTSVTTVLGLDAEILEVTAEAGAPVTRAPLRAQRLPTGVIVAAVAGPDGVEIATGTTRVPAGSRVIVVALPERVAAVEGAFGLPEAQRLTPR